MMSNRKHPDVPWFRPLVQTLLGVLLSIAATSVVQAQTDAMMTAEILSWSRSRGAFAGVDLTGASLRPDNDDNRGLYGRDVTQREILHGDVTAPPAAGRLYHELERYAFHERTGGF